MAKKIYIGVGHGSGDPGAVNGLRKEADDNLRLALKVAGYLKGQAVEYKLSRTAESGKDINARCSEANSWGADYFISLHRDSAGSTATGVSAYVYSKATDLTVKKAEEITGAVVTAMGVKNRGVKKGTAGQYTDYGVNKKTTMHSSLLEVGFISSTADNKAFDEKLDAIAKAIAKALMSVVGVTYTEPAAATTSTTGAFTVKVLDDCLNIRKGPGTSYAVAGQIKDHGVYTITEVVGTFGKSGSWGRLKSGAGWISLYSGYVKKV